MGSLQSNGLGNKSNRKIWMQACAISDLSNDPLWPRLQLVNLACKVQQLLNLTCRPLDSQHGILNGIVAVKESCIFHCPHWMVLRFPRTSLVMVGRAASRCTVCHHCHYHSSKMTHWTQISEQCRRHVVLFQSTSRDLQRLILNNCSKVEGGVSKNYVLLPAIKCSQLLLQKNGLERQTNTSSTDQHRKSKLRTNDTNQSICRLKVLKFLSRWLKQGSHKQTKPHRQWALCKAMGWGTNPIAKSECKHVQYQISQMTPCGPVCNVSAEIWEP